MEILYTESFWIAIAFFLVIAIIMFFGRGAVLGSAYERIERITKEIAHAEHLREEAQLLLVKYEKQYRESIEISKKISEDAAIEAKRVSDTIINNTDLAIERAKKSSKESIALAQTEAVKEIREKTLSQAIDLVKMVLRDVVTDTQYSQIIQHSVNSISDVNFKK